MTPNSSKGSGTDPDKIKESAVATLVYIALALFGLTVALFIDAGVLYLLGRFMMERYHSYLLVQQAHIYGAVGNAVYALLSALTGFFTAALFNHITRYRGIQHYGAWAGGAICLLLGYFTEVNGAFRHGILALLPVLAAYIAGTFYGNRVPQHQNPFRKIRTY